MNQNIKRICYRLSNEIVNIDYEINLPEEVIETLEDNFYDILEEEIEELLNKEYVEDM